MVYGTLPNVASKVFAKAKGIQAPVKDLIEKSGVSGFEAKSLYQSTQAERRGSPTVSDTSAPTHEKSQENLNPHIDWDEIATAPEGEVFKYKYNLPDGSTLGQVLNLLKDQ